MQLLFSSMQLLFSFKKQLRTKSQIILTKNFKFLAMRVSYIRNANNSIFEKEKKIINSITRAVIL